MFRAHNRQTTVFALHKGAGPITASTFTPRVTAILNRGGVGILPTDTIYGIVGSALNKKTVERIYELRGRDRKKPMIVLIGDIRNLKIFGVRLLSTHYSLLTDFWPGKVSIILPCKGKRFAYLHRGARTLAFRLPATRSLRTFLTSTGPLVAPSANREGRPPAKTIAEAKRYFGKQADFYVNTGRRSSQPSALIEIKNGKVLVLRKGAVRVTKSLRSLRELGKIGLQ